MLTSKLSLLRCDPRSCNYSPAACHLLICSPSSSYQPRVSQSGSCNNCAFYFSSYFHPSLAYSALLSNDGDPLCTLHTPRQSKSTPECYSHFNTTSEQLGRWPFYPTTSSSKRPTKAIKDESRSSRSSRPTRCHLQHSPNVLCACSTLLSIVITIIVYLTQQSSSASPLFTL